MAQSSLIRTGETPPSVQKGHGTAELGPTDSTDSGSDVRGGVGFRADERLGLRSEQRSDRYRDRAVDDAGSDIGDRGLDSDTDRSGTGERASVGRDSVGPVDQTLYDEQGNAIDGEDIADESEVDAPLHADESNSAER